jgi:hypothetical protein
MYIALNFASDPNTQQHPGIAPFIGGQCEMLWECYLSGQMDDQALEHEMAANPAFRQHVLAMERRAA